MNLRPGDGNIYPTELLSKMSQSSLSGPLRLKCIREVMIIVYMRNNLCEKNSKGSWVFSSLLLSS